MEHCHHQDGINVKQLCISLVPIFNHLAYEEMYEISKTSHSKSYLKGDMVFEAGDASDYLYIVHKGQVKIYRLSESGKEQLIRILEPGDFMGELSIFTDEVLTNYAEAIVDTEICAIHKTDFRRILQAKPNISFKILEAFSKRLNEAEKSLERFTSQDAEGKIASYLLELVNSDETKIILPMSKHDLASYLGMSRETLSRRLSTFQEKQWITQTGQRKISILNQQALQQVANRL